MSPLLIRDSKVAIGSPASDVMLKTKPRVALPNSLSGKRAPHMIWAGEMLRRFEHGTWKLKKCLL